MPGSTLEFITESRKRFGSKFDYSNTIYVNAKTNVILKCIEHDYKVTIDPNNHLKSKDGCNRLCKLHGQGMKRQRESERCKKQGEPYKKHKCSRCKGEMDDFFKNTHDGCKKKNHANHVERQKGKDKNVNKKVEKIVVKTKPLVDISTICEYTANDVKCSYKKKKGDNRWCGKHQRRGRIEEEISKGVKYCPNWVRGCDNILSADFNGYACVDCKNKNNKRE